MKFFGRRLRWGAKLWLGLMLAMPLLMLVGQLIGMPWLFFVIMAPIVLIGLPVLNTLDGRDKNRGGPGILWEKD